MSRIAMRPGPRRLCVTALMAALAAAGAGCGDEKVDEAGKAVEEAGQAVEEAGNEAEKALNDAKREAGKAGRDARDALEGAN